MSIHTLSSAHHRGPVFRCSVLSNCTRHSFWQYSQRRHVSDACPIFIPRASVSLAVRYTRLLRSTHALCFVITGRDGKAGQLSKVHICKPCLPHDHFGASASMHTICGATAVSTLSSTPPNNVRTSASVKGFSITPCSLQERLSFARYLLRGTCNRPRLHPCSEAEFIAPVTSALQDNQDVDPAARRHIAPSVPLVQCRS